MIKFWGTRPLLIKGAKIHFLFKNANSNCILMTDNCQTVFLPNSLTLRVVFTKYIINKCNHSRLGLIKTTFVP
jgi:hypothetical protein